ncbi:hypothetical protein [Microvirga yunnanensis]|uniref:hypothetical protein n=1 Tax=Microvirga yunnanensis TaxID=2953740 RepID=UPI0021CA76EE|nr:hypothetical protein [Microvirga sp. HBU65207]
MARNPSTGCLSPLNLNPKKDEAVSPDVPGSLKLDDTEFSIRMAGAGLGLFCCLRDRVGRELSAGELETVLDRWIMPNPGFHAYDASHRQVHSTLRAVLDHLES